MSETSTIETEYVSQKIFDLQIGNIKYRLDTERERVNDRLEKNQAVADKNMAEVKEMFSEIRSEINSVRSEMRAEIRELRSEIKGEIKVLYTEIKATDNRIDGLEKRFDDMKESQNKWFTVFGILFTVATIIAPVAVAVVQHFKAK
ncbi:MAG: DUF1640 domain-containing protein [Synergistaceae bacterium]|nr:DUF1640 domain-containing protein [Synergistaceae bacterium]